MTESIPPIFVISLRTSSDRRTSFARRMDELGLSFEFWDAIDGRNKSGDDFEEYDAEGNSRLRLPPLCGGEVALSLSTFKLFRHCLENNIDRVVVMEDDAMALDSFVDVLRCSAGITCPDEIVKFFAMPLDQWKPTLSRNMHALSKATERMFGKNFNQWIDWGKKVDEIDGHEIRRPWRRVDSNVAYSITGLGMRKLLRHALPIVGPIDWFMSHRSFHGADQVVVTPFPVELGQEQERSTMLGRGHVGDKDGQSGLGKWLARDRNYVHEMKIRLYDLARIYKYF